MDFRIEQRIAAPLDDVETALFDADFVAATSALPRLGDCRLLECEAGDGVTHAKIHRRFDADLGRAVTAVVDPERLTWVEHVTYRLDQHMGRHRIEPDNYSKLLHCGFTTLLTSTDDGTRRVTSGSMDVRTPLFAGRVARAIVSGLEEYADAEAALLSRWGRTAS